MRADRSLPCFRFRANCLSNETPLPSLQAAEQLVVPCPCNQTGEAELTWRLPGKGLVQRDLASELMQVSPDLSLWLYKNQAGSCPGLCSWRCSFVC